MITPESLAASGSEDGNQMAILQWCALNRHLYPETKLLYAIPNGGLRHKATAARLKATGTKRGFPDMGLPVARHGYHGMFIENKVKGRRTSDDQDKWHAALRAEGYHVVTCDGWFEAVAAITAYLGWK